MRAKYIFRTVVALIFLVTYITFLTDSHYYIVQGGDGKYYVEHKAMWGVYDFISYVSKDTLESARNARDNIYNPTNQYKIIE